MLLNKTEEIFKKFLDHNSHSYIAQPSILSSKPDFLLTEYNIIININGCYWHNHGCVNSSIPKKNFLYWINVFSRNKLRDYSNNQKLINKGYKVISVWECVLMDKRARNDLYFNLNKLIKNFEMSCTLE